MQETIILTPKISVTTKPILIKLENKNYNTQRLPTMQNRISMRRRGWSGRIPSLPLFGFFVFFGFLVTHTGRTSGQKLTIYTLRMRVFWVTH